METSQPQQAPSTDVSTAPSAAQPQEPSPQPAAPTTTSEQPPPPPQTTAAAAAAAAAAAPTSPPLPQRHTALSPGPRAARLQELYAQSLKRTLSKASWDNFAGCYPTIGKNAESVLRQVQRQMVEKLAEKGGREFENIMRSREVVAKLNELEGLIADATSRRGGFTGEEEPTPPHMLPPDQVLTAHTSPALTAHRSQLSTRLQTSQSQNAILHQDILRQREEINTLLSGLESITGDIQAANGVLDGVVGELSSEAREGDEILREVAGKSPAP